MGYILKRLGLQSYEPVKKVKRLKRWRPAHHFTTHYRQRSRYPMWARQHRHGWASYFKRVREAKVPRMKKFFLRLQRRAAVKVA